MVSSRGVAPYPGRQRFMAALLLILPLDHRTLLYLTLFLVLVFSGLGLPVPEEVTLLLGGYLAYLEFLSFWPTVYVLTSGIIVADIVGYFLGRFAGERVEAYFIRHRRIAKFLRKARSAFDRQGEKVVIFSRPFLGIRVAVPILAGHFRMNFLKFLIYDVIAAIPWTFFLVSLSYYLGSGLALITEIKEIKHLGFAILGTAILLYAAIKFLKTSVVSRV